MTARDRVTARIDPAGAGAETRTADQDWLVDLERRRTIRPASAPLPRDWLASRPQVGADLLRTLLKERDEGR